jgi:hypothetical protein
MIVDFEYPVVEKKSNISYELRILTYWQSFRLLIICENLKQKSMQHIVKLLLLLLYYMCGDILKFML